MSSEGRCCDYAGPLAKLLHNPRRSG